MACASGGVLPAPPPGVTVAPITVTSHAFSEGALIPVAGTCDGKETFPGLSWSAPLGNARSQVIIVDDPDAPGGTFTHFIVFDLPPDLRALDEGADPSKQGAKVGKNDFNATRYNGPCPPKQQEHHYRFMVYALDVQLDARAGITRDKLDRAMSGHLLGQGTLTGRFTR